MCLKDLAAMGACCNVWLRPQSMSAGSAVYIWYGNVMTAWCTYDAASNNAEACHASYLKLGYTTQCAKVFERLNVHTQMRKPLR